MKQDTDMGGQHEAFPGTRRSAVLAVRHADPQVRAVAMGDLVTGYWKPVYKVMKLLALVVAVMQKGYYLEIMLPGGILGVIVGYATQKYGTRPQTARVDG